MNENIQFFSEHDEHFELSNLSPHGFSDEGVEWPSVEQYMLGHRFTNAFREQIRTARSPKKAKLIADAHLGSVRPDWKEVQDELMLRALRLKFSSPELQKVLIETEDRPLIYMSPFDKYWGAGRDGSGQNRVGELLSQVREELSVNA